ncbi:unnamed protein product [Heligmosomoides polygyrus]|uniref:Uncharacterized protein n=1 Tax=Heligmosomoides polygyrus TaxID=6339 RepID=A0A183GU42_HELPZ|nr:unnamed protein product [Heligmosomoides polygyrus]
MSLDVWKAQRTVNSTVSEAIPVGAINLKGFCSDGDGSHGSKSARRSSVGRRRPTREERTRKWSARPPRATWQTEVSIIS